MATLYIKTPNGTDKSINIDTMNIIGESSLNGYIKLPNGLIIQWLHDQSRSDWTCIASDSDNRHSLFELCDWPTYITPNVIYRVFVYDGGYDCGAYGWLDDQPNEPIRVDVRWPSTVGETKLTWFHIIIFCA